MFRLADLLGQELKGDAYQVGGGEKSYGSSVSVDSQRRSFPFQEELQSVDHLDDGYFVINKVLERRDDGYVKVSWRGYGTSEFNSWIDSSSIANLAEGSRIDFVN